MGRRATQFVHGEYYHIYNRGCSALRICYGGRNYDLLYGRIERYADEFNIQIIASCLMPNHYHLLLRPDGASSISIFAQRTFNSYVKALNRSIARTGTLFEGPFKSRHVANEEYLVHLMRYIHRNPFEGGLVPRIEEWPHSNYLECAGLRRMRVFDEGFIRERFGSLPEYRRYVTGIPGIHPEHRAELEELTRILA